MTCGVLNRTWPHAAGAEQRSTACPPAPRVWAWLGGVCLAWACAWASPAQASEGLQPKAEDFAWLIQMMEKWHPQNTHLQQKTAQEIAQICQRCIVDYAG